MFDSPQSNSPQSSNNSEPKPIDPAPKPIDPMPKPVEPAPRPFDSTPDSDPIAPVHPDPLAPPPQPAQGTRPPITSPAAIPAADMPSPGPKTQPIPPGIPPTHMSPGVHDNDTKFPDPEHHSSRRKLMAFLIILAVVIIGGVATAYFLLQDNITENDNQNLVTNTANLNQNINSNLNTNTVTNLNTNQSQNLTYTDTLNGFTIEYPSTWTIDNTNQDVLITFKAPEAEYGDLSNVGLAITWGERDAEVTHIIDLLQLAEESSGMVFTLEDEVITTVDGLPTTARSGELNADGLTYPINTYHTGVIYSDYQIRIAGTALLTDSDDWEAVKAIFEEMASSFDRTSSVSTNQNTNITTNTNSVTNSNTNAANTNSANTNTQTNSNVNQSNPFNDADGDNLTDSQEASYGTNPNKADTDDDGLNDFREIFIYSTDPLDEDSDDDGYLDGEEVENCYDPNGPGTIC